MNSRNFQNNIHSHSFNKSSNAFKVVPNGDGPTNEGKNLAQNLDGIALTPQLVRSVPVHSGVLNSWKEIATYLGRGVRTVQRWEAELQLPVHRPRGKNRSAVMAFRAELNDWLFRTPLECDKEKNSDALLEIAQEMHELASKLFTAANSQAHPEGEKLVETAGAIMQRLDLLMNRNSEPNHFDGSAPERRIPMLGN
jgi:hypothetical protein